MTPHPLPPRPDRRAVLGAALGGATLAAASPTLAAAITAETFGVRPDGSDQTPRLQQALDAAAAAGRPLALAPGDYPVAGLRLAAGTSLVGPRSARLVQISGAPMLRGEGIAAARIVGLTLKGLGAGLGEAALVEAEAVPDLVVEDVALEDAPRFGLRLARCGGRVASCAIRRADVALFSSDATGLLVTGNDIADCLNNGVLIWRGQKGHDGAQVIGNRIARIAARGGGTGERGNGVNVFRAGGVLVADNVITECAYSAVRNNAGDGVQIVSNQVRAAGETALFTEFGFEGAVIASNLVDGASVGIVAANLNDGGRMSVISGNIVRNIVRVTPPEPGDSGLTYAIGVEGDAAVTGNVIENAPDQGIRVGWGPYLRDVAVTGNVVRECGIGIGVSVAEGAGPALVASNLITGARRGGIVGMRWRDVVADLSREAARFPHLTVTGNAVA
ncbi:TIGR03808 family TAT-translocated repetitive protein [Salinarimonas sp.]|uniref:TIGR03808 family TAT-translocated repetitive protein n=1 Tax=Salinarimonas sp. TaxID=2766526 RepID=UPI0032D9821F